MKKYKIMKNMLPALTFGGVIAITVPIALTSCSSVPTVNNIELKSHEGLDVTGDGKTTPWEVKQTASQFKVVLNLNKELKETLTKSSPDEAPKKGDSQNIDFDLILALDSAYTFDKIDKKISTKSINDITYIFTLLNLLLSSQLIPCDENGKDITPLPEKDYVIKYNYVSFADTDVLLPTFKYNTTYDFLVCHIKMNITYESQTDYSGHCLIETKKTGYSFKVVS